MELPASRWVRDGQLAAALTAVGQVELLVAADRVAGPLVLQHSGFAVMTAAVALRRQAPLWATLVCAGGLLVQTVAGEAPVVAGFLAMLVVVASLGYHATLRDSLVGLAGMTLAAASYELLGQGLVLADLVGNVMIFVGAWFMARRVRAHFDARVAAELAQDRAAREAVLAERSRISRDLHDSVAHALTVMTLQAGAVRERLGDGPTAEALDAIGDAGRAAIGDMHRFLRLLGSDGHVQESPGLLDLGEVTAAARRAGLEVELLTSGEVTTVPASVGATGYRIVQEALTNTLKHAGAHRARVQIAVDASGMSVEVLDDGQGDGRPGPGAGRGLTGLRERVDLFGGRLCAQAEPDGGWRVTAWVPTSPQAR